MSLAVVFTPGESAPRSEAAQRREELTAQIRELNLQTYQDSHGVLLDPQGSHCQWQSLPPKNSAQIHEISEDSCFHCEEVSHDSHGISPQTACRGEHRQPGFHAIRKKNITWVADITLIPTAQGWLNLAAVEDRGQAGLQGFFLRLKRADAQAQAVATDMAGGYIAAVLKYPPPPKPGWSSTISTSSD